MSAALITVMPTTLKLIPTPLEVRIIDDKIREKIGHLLEEAAKIGVIEDDETNNSAALVRREIREYWKGIEKSRTELKKPIDNNVKALQKFAKGFLDILDDTDKLLGKKQNAFAYKRQAEIDEQRRKAEEEKARIEEEAARIQAEKDRVEAERLAAKEAALAAGKEPEPDPEPEPEPEAPAPVASVESGAAKTDFGFTKWSTNPYIVDASKIPRLLCEPSMSLIKAAIKRGELAIPDGMKEATVYGILLKLEPKVIDNGR